MKSLRFRVRNYRRHLKAVNKAVLHQKCLQLKRFNLQVWSRLSGKTRENARLNLAARFERIYAMVQIIKRFKWVQSNKHNKRLLVTKVQHKVLNKLSWYSLTRSLAYLLTHSSTYSLTHSL